MRKALLGSRDPWVGFLGAKDSPILLLSYQSFDLYKHKADIELKDAALRVDTVYADHNGERVSFSAQSCTHMALVHLLSVLESLDDHNPENCYWKMTTIQFLCTCNLLKTRYRRTWLGPYLRGS